MFTAPPFAPQGKTEEPCEAYTGNVCTGFGDEDQTCLMCGWQRMEHPSEQTIVMTHLGSHT